MGIETGWVAQAGEMADKATLAIKGRIVLQIQVRAEALRSGFTGS